MTETPAVDERETERVEAILDLKEEDRRPDFLPPEPEDHAWVTALEDDLHSRTYALGSGARILRDRTVSNIAPDDAFQLGYQTAIAKLRALANEDGLHVELVEVPVDGAPE